MAAESGHELIRIDIVSESDELIGRRLTAAYLPGGDRRLLAESFLEHLEGIFPLFLSSRSSSVITCTTSKWSSPSTWPSRC